MINFDIKVGNENDKRIISDIIQTSVRVYSALIAPGMILSNTCSI